MYIHSKKRLCLLIAVAGMLLFPVALQSQVSVVTIVTPPYTSNFSQYAEKVKVTVISPTAGSLRLKMTIKGDNGISIRTLETGTVSVPANTPFQVPEDYLYDFFNVSALNISGISPAELSEKGFPAGTYQICFSATVSGNASLTGQSCSAMFRVALAQPPRVLQPMCGSEQFKGGIQNILFSWAPAIGGPRWTNYTLRIVEIRDSLLSPAQALRSGTRPPFFEEEVNGNSYLYGPKDPPLEKGCRYAFEVIASDLETNTRFANNGRSEMCWFKYGKETDFFKTPIVTISEKKPDDGVQKFTPKDPFPGTFFSPASISGTLYYQYAGPNLPKQISIAGNTKPIDLPGAATTNLDNESISSDKGTKTVIYGGQKITLTNKALDNVSVAKTNYTADIKTSIGSTFTLYNTDKRDPSKSLPLANMPVSLIVKYMVFEPSSGKMKMLSSYDLSNGSVSSDILSLKPDQVLASGYTDATGNFDFLFFLKDSLGMVAKDISFYSGSGEFKTHYKGNLFRVLRLVVGSQHYCSPAQDMIVQPGESNSYNDLYALVRNYGLKVVTNAAASSENYVDGALEGLDVYILRKNNLPDVPDDEGYPEPLSEALPSLPGYTVVARTTTKNDGTASFMHLVKNLNGYDKYYIVVNSATSQTLAYASYVKEYSNTANNDGSGYLVVPENAVYNNEYIYKDSYSTKLELHALPPVVYGQVAYTSGSGKAENEGLLAENASVMLKSVEGIFGLVQEMTTTDSEGKFSFTASTANGQKKFYVVSSKEGYKSALNPVNNYVPLLKGQKVNVGTLFLTTKAVFSGKIIDNESGSGVRCHISVLNGLSVYSTQPTILNTAATISAKSNLEKADISFIKDKYVSLNLPSMNTVPANIINSGIGTQSLTAVPLQAGTVSNKITAVNAPKISLLGPSYFALPAPTGPQTIIIYPDDNTNYFCDTIQVDLVDGNNTGVIRVLRKIHRIKVIVKVASSEQNNWMNPVVKPDDVKLAPSDKASGDTRSAKARTSGTTVSAKAERKNTSQNGLSIKQDKDITISSTKPDLLSGIKNESFYLIENAKVKVVGRTDYVLTDKDGVAYLEFDGSDAFDIEVSPPKERDLESATKTFTGLSASKEYIEQVISLKPATRISGTVTFNGQGVAGATVKLNYPGKQIETTTADDGSYTLKNVPVENSLDFEASKDKFIGAMQTLSVTLDGKEDVNFELTQSTEIDYSKMLGFPIAVVKEEKTGDKTYIYGSFTNLPRNGQIETMEEGQELTFTKLEITKGTLTGESGLPYPVPVAATITANENEAVLSLNGTFTGKLESDNNGITIAKGANENAGFIKGKVSVNTDISFQTNAVTFGSEKIFVKSSSPDSEPKSFNVIASDGAKQFGDEGIPLFNQSGKNITYTLFGFNSDAKSGLSRIDGAKVKLNTILHTNLQNTGTADLAVELGDVELTTQNVLPISKTTTITMPLEQWSLKATKWSLNNSGFKLTEGEVVTHMANVSFTNMEVEPTALKYGTFDLKKMNIRGIATLNVTGDASLIYQGGHWNLAIVPNGSSCGYIDPLPGMPANQKMNVTSVYLKSNKTGSFAVNTEPFKLYGIVDYNPTSMAVYDDRIEFPGTVNLNIPDIPSRSALIKYKKSGSETKLYFQQFSFKFNTKGVDLAFSLDENSLSSSGFTAKGTLSEPGKYSVNVQLNHNSSKTEIIDIPGQTFPIDKAGTRKLNNFDGEMHVESGQWKNFVFSGDLIGANGVSGKLTFVVNGDITADNQSVQMDKIPTPFGDLKLTYDFEKGRLIGLLEIEQDLAGTGYIKGSAESVVDAEGWYFCAGGMITMKGNPYIKNASTAMLFGDYPSLNDPFITQTFAQYSYTHTLPTAFQGQIAGFYIDGAAEFPVPYVPNIDINLIVVSGHASVSAGGNFSLGMNFTDAGTTFYTGAAVFINASIGIGGSIGIACAGASFSANLEIAQHGELHSNGDWYLEGTSTLTLTGRAYAGFGCCDSDCDGYYVCPCVDDSWSGAVSLQLLAHMGSDDNYFKIQW